MEDHKDKITCIACRLEFTDNGVMREHYKSDFHRFNLKRKAANLPSVSQELFDQKVASSAAKESQKGTQHLKNPEKQQKKVVNPPTTKKVDSENFDGEKTDEQVFAEREANAVKLSLEDSLFDNHKSATLDENLEYMMNNFSFFIPSIDYLADVAGLMDYLGQKITVGYTCLYCNKEFAAMKSVRHHMIEKAHCMMQWDYVDEYEDFYKFPPKSTVAQYISETGELEETDFAHIEPSTGELVLVSKDGGTKTLGLRQYSIAYKQKDHRYMNHQLTTSLVQEHKRLAAIEHQKKVNVGVKKQQNYQNRIRKQANMIMHFKDQNGQIM